MFWKDTFLENFLAKEAYKIQLFHGTPITNLKSILSKGLINQIYLTPEIERAARYAVGPRRNNIPAILEVVLTKPKRLKNLYWDPLDREEDIGDNYNDSYGPFFDTLQELNDNIEFFFKDYLNINIPDKLKALLTLSNEQGLHLLDGFPIYKSLLYFAQKSINNDKQFRRNKNQILGEIKSIFPIGNSITNLNITPSGTFRLSPDYFKLLKQIHYQKNLIPPSAIKAVWVRVSDFPNISSDVVKTFGIEMLPHEKEEDYLKTRNILDDLSYNIEYEFNHFSESIRKYQENPNNQEAVQEIMFLTNQFSDVINELLNGLKDSIITNNYIINQLNQFNLKWFIQQNQILKNPQSIQDYESDLNKIKSSVSYELTEFESTYDIYEPLVIEETQWEKININDPNINNILMNNKSYNKTWGN